MADAHPWRWLVGLTAVFLVVRLIGLSNWPWFWVFSPVIIGGMIASAVVGVVFLIGLIGAVATRPKGENQ